MKYRIFLFLCLIVHATYGQNYQVKGTVSNQAGEAISSASIRLINSSKAVISNSNGVFYLHLDNGTYTLLVQSMGYENDTVRIELLDKDITKHIVLHRSTLQLMPVTITATGEDPAIGIIKQAIAKKEYFKNQIDQYTCQVYNKTSLEQHSITKRVDSVLADVVIDSLIQQLQFIESVSNYYFRDPNTHKEIKSAFQNHNKEEKLDFGNTAFIGIDLKPDREVYGAPSWGEKEELFYTHVSKDHFDLYQNSVNLPSLYDKPFISPIADLAFYHYDFRLIHTFEEDGHLIHKIEVNPKRNTSPLFTGNIYIVDEEWSIKAVDLTVNDRYLIPYKSFTFQLQFQKIDDTYWMLDREEFHYQLKLTATDKFGHALAVYTKYDCQHVIDPSIFKGGQIIIPDSVKNKPLDYWTSSRPISLQSNELKYIKNKDSLRQYYASPAYFHKADSSYNHTGILDFLVKGVGYRNSKKGYKFYFDPLIAQPRPFSVGGYRHSISGNYEKTYKSLKRIKVKGEVNYGFANKDVKGYGRISYLYDPLRRREITIGGGSIYQMINSYNSITATFSRGNYMLTDHIMAGYSTEIMNGLYADGKLTYSHQRSLKDYTLADWSNTIFGDENTPQDFELYDKLLLDVNFYVRFKQTYQIDGNRKTILPNKLPRLNIHYKWGIPEVLNSSVNFHYLEASLKDRMRIGAFGYSNYNLLVGSFLFSEPNRFIDNKFFRGTDRYFFSNPLYSFQLLGPSISTSEPFFQGHIIHHFGGTLLDKVPVIRRLRLQSVLGGGALLETSNRFAHLEVYAGLERVFRIGEEIFKLGFYRVQANSTHSSLDWQFKLGFDFYNSYAKTWSY